MYSINWACVCVCVCRQIGLYCGNFLCSFFIHWIVWIITLYLMFCAAIPSNASAIVVAMTPVIVEGLFKRSIWHRLFDIRRGLRHPRLYAAADTILSITSAYTGSKSVVSVWLSLRVSVHYVCKIGTECSIPSTIRVLCSCIELNARLARVHFDYDDEIMHW